MSTRSQARYDLFLDESGTFCESDPGNRSPECSNRGRAFSSQLAGLLVPRGALTVETALDAMEKIHERTGLTLREEFHSTELIRQHRTMYQQLVCEAVVQFRARGWRPVRLVNREGVHYGDRVRTYTNLVAELVLRVFERLRAEGADCATLRITSARVKLDEDAHGNPICMEEGEYTRRLQEYATIAAVRRGLARESSALTIESFRLRSGRYARPLQLCDLVSHASHSEFSPCDEDAAAALRGALGELDFSLYARPAAERVAVLLDEGSPGFALRLLAEQLVGEDEPGADERAAAEIQVQDAIEAIAQLGEPDQRLQFTVLVTWVEQIVETRRQVTFGLELASWLLDQVANPLLERADEAATAVLAWFPFAIHRLALTASNHAGDLARARLCSQEIDDRVGAIAGQYEHTSLLMEGLTAQAVHQTDCLEHDEAARRMRIVAEHYDNLAGLLSGELDNLIPDRIHSEMRGKALGTWLQAEMYAGLAEADRLGRAREINDQALAEFVASADVARQWQYRTQIETYAGQLEQAREALARSLACVEPSHDALATAIRALDHGRQGFALLHWFRLGAEACVLPRPAERDAFLTALRRTRLAGLAWVRDESPTLPYPAHGIRRQLARIHAQQGDIPESLSALGKLRALNRGGIVVDLAYAAALTEVAVLVWASHRSTARVRLVGDAKGRDGAVAVLEGIDRRLPEGVVALRQLVGTWRAEIGRVARGEVDDDDVPRILGGFARRIGY